MVSVTPTRLDGVAPAPPAQTYGLVQHGKQGAGPVHTVTEARVDLGEDPGSLEEFDGPLRRGEHDAKAAGDSADGAIRVTPPTDLPVEREG